ncbi:MAG: hypothetical protein M3Q67_06780 [Actinomycetota bacterium]|nr:hypothetical protein [Actinomycetota bacterium]
MSVHDVVAARREYVEHEPSSRLQEGPCGAECSELLGLRLHVKEGAKRADDKRDALGDRWLAKVTHAEIEEIAHACRLRRLAGHHEHLGRGVDPDQGDTGLRDGHGDSAGSDGQLDDGAARGQSLVDIEPDVLGHGPAPRVVEARDLVVQGHEAGLRATQTNSRLSSSKGRRSNQP